MVGVAMAPSVTQRGGSDRKLDTRQARPGEKVIGADADQLEGSSERELIAGFSITSATTGPRSRPLGDRRCDVSPTTGQRGSDGVWMG
jgi:hypothetical protein